MRNIHFINIGIKIKYLFGPNLKIGMPRSGEEQEAQGRIRIIKNMIITIWDESEI